MIRAIMSIKQRTKLMKKLKKLEAKYESIKPEAFLTRKRIEREAAAVMRKLDG